MNNCRALFVFVSLFCFEIEGKLPSTFKTCKRNDPELEECFAKAAQDALPYLKEPIPELGLPSMEPVKVEKITITSGSSSSINITQTFRNLEIFNIIYSTVNKSEVTLGTKDFKAVVYVYNDLLRAECEYEMEGRILLLPITGKGNAHVEFHGMQVMATMSGEFHEKKGKTHIKLNNVIADFNPSKLHLQLDNLFNGDERLGIEMNKVINENWQDILNDLKPAYSEALAAVFKNVFGGVCDRVPYDELFPL